MNKVLEFSVPGNLILLGEYFVLQGSPALCLPTRYGQKFKASPGKMSWKSYDNKAKMYFKREDFEKVPLIGKLIDRLHTGSRSSMQGEFEVESTLEYPFEWGLGSSASTIVGFSRIYGLDPMKVHSFFDEGSGYDVAVSDYAKPVLFERGHKVIDWNVSSLLKENLTFFPLDRKVDSAIAAAKFKELDTKTEKSIITDLINQFKNAKDIDSLYEAVRSHDQVLAKILQRKRLKDELFSDYQGEVKYLGSWGGDFAMAINWENEERTRDYFKSKEITQLYSYKDLIRDE